MENLDALSALPESVRSLLLEVGPNYSGDIRKYRDVIVDAFDPILRDVPKSGIKVVMDLPYGPHARHLLDIYTMQADLNQALPVIVFVHGGAFVRGNKKISEELYGNVPRWFARNGYIGINLEYRLAPEAAFPGGADDLARALAWITQSISQFGGDPHQIFLLGHSAGGTHVAHYCFDSTLGYLAKDVCAIALVSARVRVDASLVNPNAAGVLAYFGSDAESYEALSAVTHVSETSIPTFIAIAEYENPLLDVYGAELFYRFRAAGHKTNRFMQMTGHNHMSIMAHFDTAEELLGRNILEFFRSI
jgi:acetyl esterase/lipase